MSAPDNGTTKDRNAKDDSLFWDQYIKEADLYDKELVKGLGGDLDTLLIFAGLFSAVNTAFIIESYQDLKPDPAESGGTNALLRTLIQIVNNSTAITTPPVDFIPPPHAVIVNSLFFASLCCSLFSAFGAVLAKQWLNEYERTGDNRVPHARARHRHAKYLGMQRYRCETVMQGLGTTLQVSLFLFFVALTNWLWGINHTIVVIAIVGVTVTFVFYIIATTISIYDSASPFSTRFSALLRDRLGQTHKSKGPPVATGTDEMDEMDGKCIAWVGNNATMFESISGMARAAKFLHRHIRDKVGLSHAGVGTALARSIVSSNAIPLGLTNGTLYSTINTIRQAMISWKDVPILLACDIVAQLHEMLRFAVPKDPVMSDSIAQILEHFDVDVPYGLLARTQRPTEAILIELINVPSLTVEGRRAALSLLWKYYFRVRYAHQVGSFRNDQLEGPPEESWQWRIAEALTSTCAIGQLLDPDVKRLEFRLAWVIGLGPAEVESRQWVYGDSASISPLWERIFGGYTFRRYLITKLEQHPFERHHLVHKTAINLLASNASFRPRGPSTRAPVSRNWEFKTTGVIALAFNVGRRFQPVFIVPLYWWFHAHNKRPRISLPTAYASKRYLRLAIFEFLAEQLGPDPWMPEGYVSWTVAAIRAYAAEVDSLDPSLRGRCDPDTRPLVVMYDLLRRIHDGSYHFHGRGAVGQELWNCFKLVVRLLHPGDGVVKFTKPAPKMHYVERDDLGNYYVDLSADDPDEEFTLDWEEVEAITITGLDSISDSLLPITGNNYRGFDSY